ncbi:MAG: hypothetical protein HY291_10695 [Planctomycetes bacterium]|nr:hypothetical protein [Planctomycetota bacterium]
MGEATSPDASAAPAASQLARLWPWLAGGMALVYALAAAIHYAWTGDDFYIALRYAQNLAAGHGLVFNPGERVEGYTDFLWVLWTALGLKAGVRPETWANLGSIACYLGTLALLIANYFSARKIGAADAWALPVAALACAAIPDMNIYATSGLETSAYTFLLVAGFMLLTLGECGYGRLAGAGFVFGLAYLTRPDAVIMAFFGGLFVLWRARDRWRGAAVYSAAFALVWYPHMYWRMAYYEDVFPNTYYAKLAYESYYEQGLTYLRLFYTRYWALLPAVASVFLIMRGNGKAAPAQELRARSQIVLALFFIHAYTIYVVRVGGDFMYARLLVPTIPFYAILLEHLLFRVPKLKWHAAFASGLCATLLLTPCPVGPDLENGVVEERLNYHKMERYLDYKSDVLKTAFDGLPVRLGIFGSEARLAAQLGSAEFIECHGLCDRLIAHQQIEARGIVGHEKIATPNYLIMQRKVHFTFLMPQGYDLYTFIPKHEMILDHIVCHVLHWDAPLMAELKRRGAVFVDFPMVLDAYIAGNMNTEPDAEVRKQYAKCQRFYFAFNDDMERENAFRKRLGLPQRSR